MTATLLIVEDEADLSELMRYNLEAESFRVVTAESGDEAVERIRDGVPDLILLDWMLPGLSGIELCRRWRSREETARTPIIMITARGEEEERVRGLATGADGTDAFAPAEGRRQVVIDGQGPVHPQEPRRVFAVRLLVHP